MKKIFSIALIASLFCAAVFAEGFTVKKTVGKVNYESAPGVWTKVNVGTTISGTTVLDVGLHSSIDLSGADGKVYNVKAMKKGTVDSLISKGTGLKKASNATAGSVAGDKGTSSSVSTASSRASEAKEDLDWDE